MKRSDEKTPNSAGLLSHPAGESFFDQLSTTTVWPQNIATNHLFQEQCANQQAVLVAVKTLFADVPIGCSITDGLESGTLSESVVIDFYHQLTTYLEREPANRRIILYLPLELSAPVKLASAASQEVSAQFQTAYRTAWLEQLKVHDVRANFVDGNVLEAELRTTDHPRVVKAMHLLPGLITSGHINFSEALTIVDTSDDTLLKENFGETFLTMQGLQAEIKLSSETDTVKEIFSQLNTELALGAGLEPKHSTPSRTAWIRKNARQQALVKAAAKLSRVLLQDKEMSLPEDTSQEELLSSVDAVRQATLVDKRVYTNNQQWLEKNSHTEGNSELTDVRNKLYFHLHAVGIVDTATLVSLGMRIPKLEGPFSSNLPHFIPSTDELAVMVKTIESDEYLSSRVYPVIITLGSQLKGYGIGDADADVAVFIKPSVKVSESDLIKQKLRHLFRHKRIGGSALMFWLKSSKVGLEIVENMQTTGSLPLPTWAHILLGGAWIGNEKFITKLRHELLTPFLYDTSEVLDNWPVRNRWLEELERDTILYRLLHKGYERFFPILSPYNNPDGRAIDGHTAFYDPRFRRIATELYLTKVFLPNLGHTM